MAIAETATKEEKITWLVRPIEWASNACLFGLVIVVGMIFDSKIDATVELVFLLIVLASAMGLMTWGVRRINLASRGRTG